MITRERIELRISHLNDALTGKCQPAYKTWANENIELCTLALQALDMQPRPIAEDTTDRELLQEAQLCRNHISRLLSRQRDAQEHSIIVGYENAIERERVNIAKIEQALKETIK
jgi:hypothetical protein